MIDGLNFDVTAAPGDVVLFKPFAEAAANINTVFSSPRELAVASQVQLGFGAANTGTLSLVSLRVTDDAAVPASATLVFDGTGQYSFLGATPLVSYPYVPGDSISYGSWELKLNGSPRPGDTATVAPADATFISRNAGNALALQNLRDALSIDGGRLTDGYASLLSQVGVSVQSAQYAVSASQAIADNLANQNSSVSSVNLDEEAARLMQFQQAYQASAKILQVAQRVFDTMLQELGR